MSDYSDSQIIDWLNNNRWATNYFSRRCDIRDVIIVLMNGYKGCMRNEEIEKLFH